MIDANFIQACQFVGSNIPFFISKPDRNSYDVTVPYLSKQLNLPLVKVGVHDLGGEVNVNDALYLIGYVLTKDFDKTTLLWVEDISGIDNKIEFVKKIIEQTKKNTNTRIVFTGVGNYCKDMFGVLPILEWDTRYNISDFSFTYVLPNQCETVLESPQDIHFRVYYNMWKELVSEFGVVPPAIIEVADYKMAPLSSGIQILSLCIKKGTPMKIMTRENYIKHTHLIDTIIKGLTKEVKICYNIDNI